MKRTDKKVIKLSIAMTVDQWLRLRKDAARNQCSIGKLARTRVFDVPLWKPGVLNRQVTD